MINLKKYKRFCFLIQLLKIANATLDIFSQQQSLIYVYIMYMIVFERMQKLYKNTKLREEHAVYVSVCK